MNLHFAGMLEFKICFIFQNKKKRRKNPPSFWIYLHTLKFEICKLVYIVFACILIGSMYNPFTVKSYTIKGCMGRQKIYRILHCLSLVMGAYTTSGNRVKKSVKSPIPNNSRCEYFWKIWSHSKCQIKTKEKLLIHIT